MFSLKSYGDFKRTEKFLKNIQENRIFQILDAYGKKGVDVLANETPMRTGRTANSWFYKIDLGSSGASISWYNSSMGNDGKTPIVVLIVYGHGTKNGGYVPPNDFVSPALEKIANEAIEAVWNEVKKL